ncbi:MAG: hypothetical protein ABI407_10875, partial [Bradyrhizobium sp.]
MQSRDELRRSQNRVIILLMAPEPAFALLHLRSGFTTGQGRNHQLENIPLSGVSARPPPPLKRRSAYFGRNRILWPGAIAMIFGLVATLSWMQLASHGIVRHGWTFDPVIIAAAAVILLIYAMGVTRGAASTISLRRWRHAAFAAGI